MTEWAVELKDVKKTYRTGPIEVPALRGISLQVALGEFLAIAGPSGCGKTTLLNIIGLLDRPTSGRLYIKGQDTSALDDVDLTRLRGHSIGFVFQYHYLISAFTALENVMTVVEADSVRQRSFPPTG